LVEPECAVGYRTVVYELCTRRGSCRVNPSISEFLSVQVAGSLVNMPAKSVGANSRTVVVFLSTVGSPSPHTDATERRSPSCKTKSAAFGGDYKKYNGGWEGKPPRPQSPLQYA